MRRLAIIDVANGVQPVSNNDGRISAIFNGEIYNFQELQRQLRGRGHTLQTESDSACLPALYEDLGPSMLRELRGMFALAIQDSRDGSLFLARDRLGKKPLYYHVDNGRLWFASELKALLAVTQIPRELDSTALDHYMTYNYVPNPRSIIRRIQKLPPGHYLTWRNGRTVVREYWRPKYDDTGDTGKSEKDLCEELRAHVLDATKVRMVAERPLGAFLSGGLDSSAIVAAMARLSTAPVKTFSIGFDEGAFNELPYAKRVSEIYGTQHEEIIVRPNIEDLLPRVARAFDEPFADSSAVPSYQVAEMARQHVVVALNGDGGDEALGGYTTYTNFLKAMPERRIPRPLAAIASHAGASVDRHPSPIPRLNRLVRIGLRLSATSPADRYGQMTSHFLPSDKKTLYRPEFASQVVEADPYAVIRDTWKRERGTDIINRMLATDVSLYLPGDLLPKVDITTMAVSLEARSPLLDQRFVEWAAALPGNLKVRNGTTKYLFKKALAPWLPEDIIHRKKRGFAIPREEWLRGPLRPMVHDLLLAADTRINSCFYPSEVRRWVRRNDQNGDVGSQVWSLLMLELWHREVLEK